MDIIRRQGLSHSRIIPGIPQGIAAGEARGVAEQGAQGDLLGPIFRIRYLPLPQVGIDRDIQI